MNFLNFRKFLAQNSRLTLLKFEFGVNFLLKFKILGVNFAQISCKIHAQTHPNSSFVKRTSRTARKVRSRASVAFSGFHIILHKSDFISRTFVSRIAHKQVVWGLF